MRFTVEVDPKTMAEIERKINSLLDPFEARDVENELYAAMRPLDRQVRQNIRSMTKRHTGNLLRGVKSSRGKRRHRLFSWAFVAMDYKKAPHSYLVEYGHEIVGHKPGLRRTGKFTRPV